MANIPSYQRQITPKPAGKALLPLVDTGAGLEAAGLANLGKSLDKFGTQLLQIKTAEDVAQGTAEYNNIINEYNLSLKDKEPENYLEQNEAGEYVLPKELTDRIQNIYEGKTGYAARNLQNKIKVWNEANRASIAILAINDKSDDIRQTVPEILADFAQHEDDAGAIEYINNITKITGVQSAKDLKILYGKLKDSANIFRAINLASDNPTKENLNEARKIIEEISPTERDKYYNLQKLRALTSSKNAIKGEAYKARIENESLDLANTFSQGQIHSGEITPELEAIRQQFYHRSINHSLDTGDGQTYDYMLSQINQGKYYSQSDLTEAYASGLSTGEYNELIAKNQENSRLTTNQKDRLSVFYKHINDKHNTLLSMARPKFSANTLPTVMLILDKDTKNLQTLVRNMVREDKTDLDIYEAIEANYVKTEEANKMRTQWWKNIFLPRSYELKEGIRELTGQDERFDVIENLLKSGEKKDYERAQALLKKWYE